MSACYCDWDEAPTMYSQTTHTARKQHKCNECRAPILPGETYEKTAGVWGGDFSTYKTCQHCLGLRNFIQAHVPCFCWQFTVMVEQAIDLARNYAHEAPGLLFGAYRFQIRSRRARRAAKAGSQA